MQALDNFISPIPGFNGDVPILTMPILTQPPGNESVSDTPHAGASARVPKTRPSKRKAAANPTLQKKAKKVAGRFAGGIKINEPTLKAPAPTPPLGPC
jgi:hypothetical protein